MIKIRKSSGESEQSPVGVVGDLVGDAVGELVGNAVGEAVGDAVGEAVGDAVGGVVGLFVGMPIVGDFVETPVGSFVGFIVGEVVGEVVGEAVGADVVFPIVISNVIVAPAALIFDIVTSVSMMFPPWYAFVFGCAAPDDVPLGPIEFTLPPRKRSVESPLLEFFSIS